MDIKETTDKLVEKGKAVLDIDKDGQVETQEIIDAVTNRVKETAEAAGVAFDEVKKGFDADSDGAISMDEVKAVADGIAGKAKELFDGFMGKKDEAVAEAEEVVEAAEPVVEEAAAEVEEAVEADVVEDAPAE